MGKCAKLYYSFRLGRTGPIQALSGPQLGRGQLKLTGDSALHLRRASHNGPAREKAAPVGCEAIRKLAMG